MNKWLLPLLAIACLTPALALAGPAGRGATQRKPKVTQQQQGKEPIHLQVARVLFPRENWQRFMREASTSLTQQIAETGKGQIILAPGFAARLQEQYEELVPYEEMLRYQARLLDSQYTQPELHRLLAFYRTPLGRRSLPFMHDLVDSSLQRAQLKVQNQMAAALAPLRPLVRHVPAGAPEGADPGADDQAQRDPGTGASAADDDKAL